MAAASYAVGLLIAGVRLRRRMEGRLDGKRLRCTYGSGMALLSGGAGLSQK